MVMFALPDFPDALRAGLAGFELFCEHATMLIKESARIRVELMILFMI